MRTPAEWGREFGAAMMVSGWVDFEAWASAIQSDARAGMVPEVDMATLRTHLSDEIHRLEAELAKAWEAGAEAAACEVDAYPNPLKGNANSVFMDARHEISRRIRALQPPGGKAK